jgi:N-acetylglucosamine-6-sulfatase
VSRLSATGRPLVLALGDSITAAADWPTRLLGAEVVNAGVPGDQVRDVLARLAGVVRALEPRVPDVVLVLVGTNDLGLGERPVDDVVADLAVLAARVRAELPTSRLVLQSVMPRTRWFAERLGELNAGVAAVAAGAGAEYLDLWPALADARGRLRRGFTRDGLHLTQRGEEAWLAVLAEAITAR